jgi:competence protein ComEC
VSNPQYSSSVLVTIPVWPPVSKGDHITVTGLLEPIENFDSFDYRRWLAGKGVVSSLEAKSFEMWSTTPYTVTNILERCRSWISWRIRTLLPNPEAAFLQGLLLGDDDGLPESLIAALRHTGTSHLTAISGANIAIVLTLLTPLLPFRKRHHTFIASCAIAFGIAVMTGASASVVRGAVVVVLGGLITLLGLPGNTTMLLALALAAMTVVNPLAPSSDPSFQLSFAAFAGLGYFSQPISFLMQKIAPALPPWLKAPIQETTAASLGSVPVAGMVMGQWNWYGLIVNPLVLPFIPLATAAGGVLCIGFGLETILTLPTWLLLTTPLRIISHLGGSRW